MTVRDFGGTLITARDVEINSAIASGAWNSSKWWVASLYDAASRSVLADQSGTVGAVLLAALRSGN